MIQLAQQKGIFGNYSRYSDLFSILESKENETSLQFTHLGYAIKKEKGYMYLHIKGVCTVKLGIKELFGHHTIVH